MGSQARPHIPPCTLFRSPKLIGCLRQHLGAVDVLYKRAGPSKPSSTQSPACLVAECNVAGAGLYTGRPRHGTNGVSPFRPMSFEPANRPRPLMKPQRADDTLAAEASYSGLVHISSPTNGLVPVVRSIVETSHNPSILTRVLLHWESLCFPFPPRGSSSRPMESETRTRAAGIQVYYVHGMPAYLDANDEGVGYLLPSHHAPPSSAGNTSYQATALRSNSPQTL
ncbi:hypothetical protein F5Y08DRAFT_337574 [Xylaria arbuscula]|nr:hypothetical protein F5Y08DRAFT_337574 [Xylaria arbuscula]